ncbi:ufm1-specific protease 2-like [Coccinella septempunctata]|uniref:ufm1-specific protease 2-like n=1 Tax=Coccinella septempunctata TaxID=41139 RepID=UPI001D05F8A6|nr:ufm1-specific protease 2-like [Coccinella septempunctata]
MKPTLQISQYLIEKLSRITEPKFAKLYGVFFDNMTILLAVQMDSMLVNDLEYCLPTEFDLYGIVEISNKKINQSEIVKKLQQEVDVTDNPIFLSCGVENINEITAYILIHGQLQETSFKVVSEKEIYEHLMYVRLTGTLPITCNAERSSYDEAILDLRNTVTSGKLAFNIVGSPIYLLGNETETGNSNGEPTFSDIFKHSNEINACERKKNNWSSPYIINMKIMKKVSKDNTLSGDKEQHAPICFLTKKQKKTAFIPVKIDVLSLISKQTSLIRLYAILVESILKNLKAYHLTLLKNLTEKDALVVPECYHFYPINCGHFISVWMPTGVDQGKFEPSRRALHKQFLLPMQRPLFRRENRYSFQNSALEDGPLVNPHEVLKNTNNDGKVALVKGKYSYYHYNQNNINDSGWGCAYRSLQTLASWFKWQGYVDREVPTFEEIQKCLVDIGDKPVSFIGSRQWIGSMEVNFVLNSLLGVTCRIINVSNGLEMAYEGPQLVRHFEEYGTPIMIGGGNLAHTILGVDYNEGTGNIKFLILDPHYVGPEDLNVIQTKGWCGWKGLEFWSKTSYYNMCLPLVPTGI